MGTLGLEMEGFRRGAGEEGEGVAGGEEARGHGGAHYADANPSYAGFGWDYGCWIGSVHCWRDEFGSVELLVVS